MSSKTMEVNFSHAWFLNYGLSSNGPVVYLLCLFSGRFGADWFLRPDPEMYSCAGAGTLISTSRARHGKLLWPTHRQA